ncbi:MAG: AAA family ATPase [Candidatus Nitrotoga sp.]|nr:AAA family ATPase [Candidatus Nitrotoga sp.]
MLIEFSCENYKCFAHEVRLQLTAANFSQHPNHVRKVSDQLSALRAIAIYGANAAGKTKLVEAIKFAQGLINNPRRANAGIPHFPFILDKKLSEAPSRFEFIFFYRNQLFTYGFVAGAKHIEEEWLFVSVGKREYRCFERKTSSAGKVEVEISTGLARKNSSALKRYSELNQATAANQLFINKLDDFQSERANDVVTWFEDVLTIIEANSSYTSLELRAHTEQEFVSFIGDYLRNSYTGVDSIETIVESFDAAKHLPGLSADKVEEIVAPLRISPDKSLLIQRGESSVLKISQVDGKLSVVRLQTIHKSAEGKDVAFGFENESAGTQRLANLLPAIYDLKFSERVYVIDELDRKLHPLLTKSLVQNFLDSTGCKNGQLIFTTHETHLLDQEMLRRDEVWFIEKNIKNGESELIPLTEFDVRHDLKIEKGYLQGRFGAIPFFSEPSLVEK